MHPGFIETDRTKIAWTRALKNELAKGSRFAFDANRIVPSLYRPFTKYWLYFDRKLNEMVLLMPRLFPRASAKNLVIGVSGIGSRPAFTCLLTDAITSLDLMEKAQFFPLYLYDAENSDAEASDPDADPQPSLFATPGTVRAGVSVFSLVVVVYALSSYGGELQRMYRAAWRVQPGASGDALGDIRRRLGWVLAFVGFVAFLSLNGYELNLPDAEASNWVRRVKSGDVDAAQAVEKLTELTAGHHEGDPQYCMRAALAAYPQAVEALR